MSKRKTSVSSEDEDEYLESPRKKKYLGSAQKKERRRRESPVVGNIRRSVEVETPIYVSLAELGYGLEEEPEDFEQTIADSIASLIETKESYLRSQVEVNHLGQKLRPLTIQESRALVLDLQERERQSGGNPYTRLILRKLLLQSRRRQFFVSSPKFTFPKAPTFKAPSPLSTPPPPDPEVIQCLNAIRSTPFERSLAARIAGFSSTQAKNGYLLRDWEARSPWMDLMDDIHEHHSLRHPEREQTKRPAAPIDYQSLCAEHLPQVHDLLTRTFWPGINVSDSLHYSPEKCTVVVTYRHLVVGVAILSSPQETYLTYFAVRAGWEDCGIARRVRVPFRRSWTEDSHKGYPKTTIRNMLYSLITRNPGRDILLHVSVNNPAMLLYNRFGFKPEEFIVGFYEDYLDSQSRASKNAFRMRLRS